MAGIVVQRGETKVMAGGSPMANALQAGRALSMPSMKPIQPAGRQDSGKTGNDPGGNRHPPRGHLLIAEDEAEMQHQLTRFLDAQQEAWLIATSPAELYRQLRETQPSAVILNARLGGADSSELLRALRAQSDIPVIVIADAAGDDIDAVVSLELGADDYLRKPVCAREVLARLRAVLRRQEIGRAPPPRGSASGGYHFNAWRLELGGRKVFNAAGRLVVLTRTEFDLLLAFLKAPLRPLAREHLLRASRSEIAIADRSIDVQVLRLRRKLEADPDGAPLIRTERGIGYLLVAKVVPF
jgi:DNA-binding response OmpR family regulator